MDHQPPNTPEFHRRGLLLVHALGGPLRRVTLIGGIVAAVVGAAVIVALGTGAPFQAAALAGLVGGGAGTGVAILAVPRRVRSAFEAFSWLRAGGVRPAAGSARKGAGGDAGGGG